MEAALSEDALDLGIAFGAVQSRMSSPSHSMTNSFVFVVDAGHPAFIHDELAVAELDKSTSHCSIPASPRESRSIVTWRQQRAATDRCRLQLGRGPSWRFCAAAASHHHAPSRRPRGARPEGLRLRPPIAGRTVSLLQRDGLSAVRRAELSPDAAGVGLGSVTPHRASWVG